MNIDLLFTIPDNKEAIRRRVSSTLDWFVEIRSRELGLNATDLRQALPEICFFDELGTKPISSALGACNYGSYVVKINEVAIFSGKISVEIIALHEYTHILDTLLVDCFTEDEAYTRWVKRYFLTTDTGRYNMFLPDYGKNYQLAQTPEWEEQALTFARRLMRKIMEKPDRYFELGEWGEAVIPMPFLESALIKNKLCNDTDELDRAVIYLKGLHFRYLDNKEIYRLLTKSADYLSAEQKSAIEHLREQAGWKVKRFSRSIRAVPYSLQNAARLLEFGYRVFKVESYFNLPEEIQLGYFCSEGEIRARREASRILLGVVRKRLEQVSSRSKLCKDLQAEKFTLESSIQLEDLLMQWKSLSDRTPPTEFINSRERLSLESDIQKIAPFARTHKLPRRFYPNDAVYQLCQEWNDKRVFPYPKSVLTELNDLNNAMLERV